MQLGAGSWGEKPRISGCFYPKETPGWVLELPGGEFRRDGNPGVSGALVAGGSREVQAPVTPAILQGNRARFRTFWGIFDPQKNHTRRVFRYLQVGGGDQSSVQPLLPGGGRLWERGKKIPNSRSEKRGRVGRRSQNLEGGHGFGVTEDWGHSRAASPSGQTGPWRKRCNSRALPGTWGAPARGKKRVECPKNSKVWDKKGGKNGSRLGLARIPREWPYQCPGRHHGVDGGSVLGGLAGPGLGTKKKARNG